MDVHYFFVGRERINMMHFSKKKLKAIQGKEKTHKKKTKKIKIKTSKTFSLFI